MEMSHNRPLGIAYRADSGWKRYFEQIQNITRNIDEARIRQDEYIAKRVEAGDKSAKPARREADKLQPGPSGSSEVEIPDQVDEVMVRDSPEGGPARSRTHSRVSSTATYMPDKPPSAATCATDLPVDVPIPNVEDPGKATSSAVHLSMCPKSPQTHPLPQSLVAGPPKA